MSKESDNIDYQETLNVSRAHAVSREKGEPVARREPLSLWVIVGFSVVMLLGAGYLGAYVSGFDQQAYFLPGYQPIEPKGDGPGVGEDAGSWLEKWVKSGKGVYGGKGACIGCHQASGGGAAGQFPPLVGSEYVVEGDKQLIAILLHGLGGPIVVKGVPYNGQMPPQGAALSDKEIAQVATYIRQEWGNDAPFVTEAAVAKVREETSGQVGSYTADSLAEIDPAANADVPAVDPLTGQSEGEPEGEPAA